MDRLEIWKYLMKKVCYLDQAEIAVRGHLLLQRLTAYKYVNINLMHTEMKFWLFIKEMFILIHWAYL